jgi:hypothetical protein
LKGKTSRMLKRLPRPGPGIDMASQNSHNTQNSVVARQSPDAKP